MAVALLNTQPSRAARLAQRCVSRLGLFPPVDLNAVARACRLPLLEQAPGGPSTDAMLVFRPQTGQWGIFLNPRCKNRGRRRFSIAHELGHYILHRELIRLGDPLDSPELEEEANEFASELLIPTEELRFALQLCCPTLDLYFGVSWSAIYYRMRRLGYRFRYS